MSADPITAYQNWLHLRKDKGSKPSASQIFRAGYMGGYDRGRDDGKELFRRQILIATSRIGDRR